MLAIEDHRFYEHGPLDAQGTLRALVTNVCLSGELEIVNSMRCRILNSTPISLVG